MAVPTSNLLVMSSPGQSPLLTALVALGYQPIIRQSTEEAVHVASRMPVHAMIIEAARSHEDTMEVILNVRDVRADIPIIVIDAFWQRAINPLVGNKGKTTFLPAIPAVEELSRLLDELPSQMRPIEENS